MTEKFENTSDDTSVSVEKTAMENPFDGYGRPFTDDPLTSDIYNHDNPANNVGPYSGPSSYSINTTAPYGPPHGGEENPAQNVGPYNPPTSEESLPADVDTDDDIRTAYSHWDEQTEWFDGSSRSVYDRIIEGQALRRKAVKHGAVDIEDQIAEQIEVLAKVANELDDSNLHEYVDMLPGGTVALEYDDLIDGGLIDVDSFIHTEAAKIYSEAKSVDWDVFVEEGARQWILAKVDNNPGLLKHEKMAREAAVDYVKNKTMVLIDPIHRAEIIDEFVSNAERFRREAAKRVFESRAETEQRKERLMREAQRQVTADVDAMKDGFLPGQYVSLGADFDADGNIAIGEDDGSHLYTEAKIVIESHSARDWANFTTEGANEWFWDKVATTPTMFKHADITRRAAKDYAREQTGLVRDDALKNEIVRAFTQSVEYLRDGYAKQNTRVAHVEQDDTEYQQFEDVFGGESEILW